MKLQLRKTIVLTALSLLVTHAWADDALPRLAGTVLSAQNWSTDSRSDYGAYAISLENGELQLTPLYTNWNMVSTGGSVLVDDYLYVMNYENEYGYATGTQTGYLVEDWSAAKRGYIRYVTQVPTARTYDATDGYVYGCFYNKDNNGFELGRLSATGDMLSRNTIATLNSQYVAMAADAEGTLYAINVSGQLLKVDKANGTETVVGATGVTPSTMMQGAISDPASGKIYWSVPQSATASALYEVNPTTGAATKVADFPHAEHVTGLWIVKPLAADDAPAAPENLTFTFEDPSLTGTIGFDMPSTTYGEGSLTGELSYTVSCNDEVVATGTARSGVHVEAEATLNNGWCHAVVVAANEAGTSPKLKGSAYIGPDEPEAIWTAELTIDGRTATITWEPSESGANGGYFVPEEVTYNITRYPDEVEVAIGVEETTYVDELPEVSGITTWFYGITPVFMERKGYSGETNKVTSGSSFEVPYEQTFESWDATDLFTIIDANEDWYRWYGTSGYAYSQSGYDSNNDDWLISPPIHLQPGQFYDFSVRYWGGYEGFEPHAFDLAFGTSANPDDMTVVGHKENILLDEEQKAEYKALVHVEEEGDYYFDIHDISPSGGHVLYIDRFCVTAGSSLSIPADITDLSATAGEDLEVMLNLTAPATSADGEPLTSLDKVELLRDGELLHTFSQPIPGEQLSFTDTEATGLTDGRHTYTASATNAEGTNQPSEVSITVGITAPGMVSNVRIKDMGDHIHISWDAPTTDINGQPLNTQGLYYAILGYAYFTGQGFIVSENCTETEFDDYTTFDLNGEQKQIYYYVQATNRAGYSEAVPSNQIVVGRPDELPYSEGWGENLENQMEHLWWIDMTRDINGMAFFGMVTGISADGDGGSATFIGNFEGQFGNLNSGKISLANATEPTLTFSYLANDWTETAALEVRVTTDLEQWQTIKRLENEDFLSEESEEWRECTIDMSPWAGEDYIYLTFHAESSDSYSPVTIDNVRITDVANNIDIVPSSSLSSISILPSRILIGGHPSSVQVYGLDGRLLFRGIGNQAISLKTGQYIVIVDGKALKVNLKLTCRYGRTTSK